MSYLDPRDNLRMPALDAAYVVALIDRRTRRITPQASTIINSSITYADAESGVGPTPSYESSIVGPFTIAASGTLTHTLGTAANLSAVFVKYSFLRNSLQGRGRADGSHNIATAALSMARTSEGGEGPSLCTFNLNISGTVLRLQVVNGDASNAVVISLAISLIPALS